MCMVPTATISNHTYLWQSRAWCSLLRGRVDNDNDIKLIMSKWAASAQECCSPVPAVMQMCSEKILASHRASNACD